MVRKEACSSTLGHGSHTEKCLVVDVSADEAAALVDEANKAMDVNSGILGHHNASRMLLILTNAQTHAHTRALTSTSP